MSKRNEDNTINLSDKKVKFWTDQMRSQQQQPWWMSSTSLTSSYSVRIDLDEKHCWACDASSHICKWLSAYFTCLLPSFRYVLSLCIVSMGGLYGLSMSRSSAPFCLVLRRWLHYSSHPPSQIRLKFALFHWTLCFKQKSPLPSVHHTEMRKICALAASTMVGVGSIPLSF